MKITKKKMKLNFHAKNDTTLLIEECEQHLVLWTSVRRVLSTGQDNGDFVQLFSDDTRIFGQV